MPNELADATSPYLQQHKDNPVHWLQWSPRALELARQENKPILLSVGYAACHWCHVMAHESFEDETTAELMNRLFVNIKVDREERPDIDQIYMAALHAMGQPGGWPLTMFLTPDGAAFWGGTYFPKQPSHGRPSFSTILTRVSEVFQSKDSQIQENVEQLRAALTSKPFVQSDQHISNSTLTEFAKRLHSHMDSEYGGLQGSPRFPNTPILEFFFRRADRTGNESYSNPAVSALKGMCLGGIRDHIGGGFARYSVDDRWFAPHFEKMLYDNALILEQLCLGWERTSWTHFQVAAEEIVAWLQREMLVENCMFAASLDADSEGVEGKYYCWTMDELSEVLDEQELQLFCRTFSVLTAGNWTEHHTGLKTNIVQRIGMDIPLSDPPELQSIKRKLLSRRTKRIPPGRDEKILADWNGLMIAALARAAQVFHKPEWLKLATDAFHALISTMVQLEDGDFLIAHSKRGDRLLRPGMATDYAYLIRAALILHDCGSDSKTQPIGSEALSCIKLAQGLTRSLIRFYADPKSGVLSLARLDAEDIVYRHLVTTDDAVPNPNSTFLQSLQILSAIEEADELSAQAAKMIGSITQRVLENPFGHTTFLNAMDDRLNSYEVIITGKTPESLLETARELSFLSRFIVNVPEDGDFQPSRFPKGTSAQAYVCKGQTCSLPYETSAELKAHLRLQPNE